MSEHVKKYLKDVMGVVEATSYEKHMLWREYAEEASQFAIGETIRYKWEETGHGYGEHIGDIGGKPVCVSILTSNVDGKHLLFWHVTSIAADYEMIDRWLVGNCPNAVRSDGFLNRVDPMNFCNILHQPYL